MRKLFHYFRIIYIISAIIWMVLFGVLSFLYIKYNFVYLDVIMLFFIVHLSGLIAAGFIFRFFLVNEYRNIGLKLKTKSTIVVHKIVVPIFVWSFQVVILVVLFYKIEVLGVLFFWSIFSIKSLLIFNEFIVFGNDHNLIFTNLFNEEKVLIRNVKFRRLFFSYYQAEYDNKKKYFRPNRDFRRIMDI